MTILLGWNLSPLSPFSLSPARPPNTVFSVLAGEGGTLLAPPTVSWRVSERHTQDLNP